MNVESNAQSKELSTIPGPLASLETDPTSDFTTATVAASVPMTTPIALQAPTVPTVFSKKNSMYINYYLPLFLYSVSLIFPPLSGTKPFT